MIQFDGDPQEAIASTAILWAGKQSCSVFVWSRLVRLIHVHPPEADRLILFPHLLTGFSVNR